MDLYFTPPIQPTGESFREKPRLPVELNHPTDSKVKGLVLPRIGQATSGVRTALLPSATAPRIMFNLLAALAIPALEDAQGEQRIELMSSPRAAKEAELKKDLREKHPDRLAAVRAP